MTGYQEMIHPPENTHSHPVANAELGLKTNHHVRSPWVLRPGFWINTPQIENFAEGNDIMKYHTDGF